MANLCYCSCLKIVEKRKPYLVMIFVQFIYAGMALFSKAAISKGMNPFVFVAYRQAFAALALLPFAFFLDRITLSLNLYTYAMSYVSATFAAASINNIPALTFLIAVIFRIERLSLRDFPAILKLVGSGLTLSGAMVFALVKGPQLNFMKAPHSIHDEKMNSQSVMSSSRHYKWILGCLLMFAANTTWASWLVLQANLVKQYPAKFRLTMLQCLCSCIQATVWGMAMERNMSSWRPRLDMNLLSVAYCGVIVTGLCYWLQLWSVESKGPLFTATFTPLSLIITVIFSAIVWNETLHLGSICGGMLLVGGLYCVLWGKNKESRKEANNEEATTTNV